jgi:hypothetical protein
MKSRRTTGEQEKEQIEMRERDKEGDQKALPDDAELVQ